jgi:hypothetical protein
VGDNRIGQWSKPVRLTVEEVCSSIARKENDIDIVSQPILRRAYQINLDTLARIPNNQK